jgi:hypothetical protein
VTLKINGKVGGEQKPLTYTCCTDEHLGRKLLVPCMAVGTRHSTIMYSITMY